MSELIARIHALFDEPTDCAFVAEGLELAQGESLAAANAHFAARAKKALFAGDAPHPEGALAAKNELSVSLVYPPSGDERAFVKLLAALGASCMLVDVHNNQVGEQWSYGYINGRKSAHPKALKKLAAVNPTMALRVAVEAGQASKVERHLAASADPNARSGRAPLLSVAAAGGHARIVSMLLDAGAEVGAVTWPLDDADVTTDAYVERLTENGKWGLYYSDVRVSDDAPRPLNDGNTALHDAAKSERPECVGLLLRAGADVDARNRHLQTPLLAAATSPDATTIGLLLDAGAALDVQDAFGNTPLILLAADITVNDDGRGERVAALLAPLVARGADLSIENRQGETARGAATAREAIEFLDGHDAPFRLAAGTYTGDPENDAQRSIVHSDLEKFRQLLDTQAFDRQGALKLAAWYGCTPAVQLLLAAGADPNKPVKKSLPLFEAARSGFVDTVEALCTGGADINHVDEDGHDAVGKAIFTHRAEQRHVAFAEWALDNGWDPEPPRMTRALQAAVSILEADALIDALIARGADINAAAGETEMTALHYAVQNRPVRDERWTLELARKRLRKVLALGADVHARAHNGGTPLLFSARELRGELLDAGADIDARYADGKVPLCEACRDTRFNKSSEAEALWWIENGADVNARSEQGATPLLLATSAESRKLVEALLAAGADRSMTDANGRTALENARKEPIRALLEPD